ncbi:zinc-dependent alcohol dehydrogenase [Ammoniphilus resinae]|uniref:L-iditol 2-dehydrogenase n=1 Tax=Ammoniphilus resinae TaxID=861532 RepID=A0ABS4GXW8_9BACL|nr:alcohol dehydrogenase catalytic domain-containing protein [Ammoniphilus resinae]MBP1935091.1 L-iditol 2-dehydrogenase [Ammoniphilus resinae]
MNIAILVDIGRIEIAQQDIPNPGPNEILIKVEACGICGSDLHMFHGNHPILRPPLRMGHEVAGSVEQAGIGANGWKKGDRVLLFPLSGCGECARCIEETPHLCEKQQVIGAHIPGGFADYVLAKEENLIKLPYDISFIEGALVEPAAVAVHTVSRLGSVSGHNVAVLGVGPIGLLCVQVLKALGATTVIASDPLEHRLNLARQLGADVVVNPLTQNLKQKSFEISPLGLDAVIDCAGLEQTLQAAFEITRRGGKIAATAVFLKDVTIPMTLLQRGERSLIGVMSYEKKDFHQVIQLVSEQKLDVKALVTHKYPLQEIQRGFETAGSRTLPVGKVIIEKGACL